MELDVMMVLLLALAFNLASIGGVTTAAFVWSVYQRNLIEGELRRVQNEAESLYRQLRADYERLKREHDALELKYSALVDVVTGKAPEVHITAGGNVNVDEFAGRDATR